MRGGMLSSVAGTEGFVVMALHAQAEAPPPDREVAIELLATRRCAVLVRLAARHVAGD